MQDPNKPPAGYPPSQQQPPQGYGQPPYQQPYGQPQQQPPQGYTYDAQGQVIQGQYGNQGMQNYGYQPGPSTGMPGAYPPAPVVQQFAPQQPGMRGGRPQVQFMVAPARIAGCPPGLEYLTQIDQLLVHQQVDYFELITNWVAGDRFQIKNSLGQQVYFSSEESDACERQCCGTQRGFIMHITDNYNQEVIRVTRNFKCCSGYPCCAFSECCALNVIIEAPVGQVVGIVRQECSFLTPKYEILDPDSKLVFKVEGPCCMCQTVCCRADIEFKVFSEGGSQVGKICKQWGGWARETFTLAENFSVHFPVDLDVKMKAVLLGAVFLIDLMHFERKKNDDNMY